MNKNLEIWDAVFTTDPAYTKAYKGDGGFQGTAVTAHYVVMKATEQFGPIGIGWGYTVLEERYIDGAPLKCDPTTRAIMHTLKLQLWYLHEGERRTVEHYGNTKFVSENKYGPATDFEAPKKSLTDAMKKALSMLGFTADIHMGLHDDIAYIGEVRDQMAIEKADDRIEEAARQAIEYKEWLDNNLKLINTAISLRELNIVYRSAIRKLDLRKDEKSKLHFAKAMDARKAELEKLQEEAK